MSSEINAVRVSVELNGVKLDAGTVRTSEELTAVFKSLKDQGLEDAKVTVTPIDDGPGEMPAGYPLAFYGFCIWIGSSIGVFLYAFCWLIVEIIKEL